MKPNEIQVQIADAPHGTLCKRCYQPAVARLERLDRQDEVILLCPTCFGLVMDNVKPSGVTQYKDEALDWR
jgi:hypothetical protein